MTSRASIAYLASRYRVRADRWRAFIAAAFEGNTMHKEAEKGAHDHGGKHAHKVRAMHDALTKAPATAQGRLHVAIDQGCAHLQTMKTDGSTIDDVIEALRHLLDNAAILKAAIQHGAGAGTAEPTT